MPQYADAVLTAEGTEGEARGGLHTLFTMILGGLVGASPHMTSASVMALARLLYEFVGNLQGTAQQLLPVVLSLLRSKSREVIKSVLGFVKVGAGRNTAPATSYLACCLELQSSEGPSKRRMW